MQLYNGVTKEKNEWVSEKRSEWESSHTDLVIDTNKWRKE